MGERVMSLLEFLYHQPTEWRSRRESQKILNLTIKKLHCGVIIQYKQPVALAGDREREDCSSDRRESDGSGGSGGLVLSRCEV